MANTRNLQTIKEFRRQRVAALLDEHGKVGLSKLVDISANYLWQMGKGVGKSARGVSDESAAKMESRLGKPPGWMDTAMPAPEHHSQPLRLDPAMIRQVARALDKRYAKVGGYSITEMPEAFAIAYELRAGMSDAYVSPEVFELVIQHADLSPQGASEDGRGSDSASTHGVTGGAARTR